MKKLTFLLALTMLTVLGVQAGGKTVYTSYDESTKTLTYYYNNDYDLTNANHELYDPENNPTALRWKAYHDQVKTVLIDVTMQDAPLTSLYRMFYGGSETVGENTTYYSLSNVTTITGLEYLNTASVRNMVDMFYRCESLETIDISTFAIDALVNASNLFCYCSSLKTIYCDKYWYDSEKLEYDFNMFKYCTSLVGLYGSRCDGIFNVGKYYARPDYGVGKEGYFTPPSRVYTTYNKGLDALTYYYDGKYLFNDNVEYYDPETHPTALRWTAYHDQVKSVNIDVTMQNAPLKSMYRMFYGGRETDGGTTTHYSLSGVEYINGMEYLNTEGVTNMEDMFYGCQTIQSLNLSGFNIDEVENMGSMFYGCSALQTIYCEKDWNKSNKLTKDGNMFRDCSSLVGINGTRCDGKNYITKTYARPDGGVGNKGYFTPYSKVYTAFDGNETLTYYYDGQYLFRDNVEYYDPSSSALRWATYHDKVKTAVIDPSMQNARLKSMYQMFYGGMYSGTYYNLSKMTSISGMEYLNTKDVTNMEDLFYRCYALESLDLSHMNTAKVQSMAGMFNCCYALESLDLSPFNTAKVTDMRSLFSQCKNLVSIDLSPFNTANVETMQSMFYGCESLTELDLRPLNTEKVTIMLYMFYGCKSLTELDLSTFKMDKVTNAIEMFCDCGNLTTIYCDEDLNKYSELSSQRMFKGCTSLVGGNGTPFDDLKIDKTYARPDRGVGNEGYFTLPKKVYTLFDGKETLTYFYDNAYESHTGKVEFYDPENNPDATRWRSCYRIVKTAVIDPSMQNAPLKSMYRMFYGGYFYDTDQSLLKMTSISGMEYLNTKDVTNMEDMFYDCESLTELDLSHMNTAKVQSMAGMFSRCLKLTELDLSSFNTANVTNMSYMFGSCYTLTELDLRPLNTVNVTNMGSMFASCESLTELDLRPLNTVNVTDMRSMFFYCKALTTIYCTKDWGANPKLKDSDSMFKSCLSLVGGNGTAYNEEKVKATYARPDGGPESSTPGYFTLPPEPKIYTVYDDNKTLTYYYDDQYYSHTQVEYYDPESSEARWTSYYNDVQYIVLDASMDNAPLTSLATFFYGGLYGNKGQYSARLANVKSISGLQYLHTENVTDMSKMFFGLSSVPSFDLRTFTTDKVESMSLMFRDCSSITSLDLSHFKTDVLWDTYGMFLNCSALTTIYCDEDWGANTTLRESTAMFKGCNALVGGNGTKYNESKVKATYAHLDGGESNPCYFTKKTATGIEDVQSDNVQCTKIMVDGVLYIMYNGTMYDVRGQKVK